jgi:hypothetical protein
MLNLAACGVFTESTGPANGNLEVDADCPVDYFLVNNTTSDTDDDSHIFHEMFRKDINGVPVGITAKSDDASSRTLTVELFCCPQN